jgi:predicted PurR-regulated permease PerM
VWVAVAIVIALAFASVALMVVLVLSLIRHVKGLTASVAAFQADILPLLEEIESGRERAQEQLDRLVEDGQQALSRDP